MRKCTDGATVWKSLAMECSTVIIVRIYVFTWRLRINQFFSRRPIFFSYKRNSKWFLLVWILCFTHLVGFLNFSTAKKHSVVLFFPLPWSGLLLSWQEFDLLKLISDWSLMIFGRIAAFINVLIKSTTFHLSLFYQRNTKLIPVFGYCDPDT